MRLLADKAVEMGIVESVSHETVRKMLKKKRTSSPPPQGLGDPSRSERPVRLEDGGGLGPLRGALRQKRPVVCFDERPCQLLAEVREPLGLRAGRPERRDHEYERRGMAHLFVAFQPLTGWRGVEVRERRRGREFAEFVRYLAEDLYPKAEKIRLVVDNLNIHSAASFYEVFDAERARELTRRIEFCYTPVHGSWWNMAE